MASHPGTPNLHGICHLQVSGAATAAQGTAAAPTGAGKRGAGLAPQLSV